MKYLLSILLLVLLMTSCKAPQFAIGMNEADFRKSNKSAKIVEANQNTTIYKVMNYTTNPHHAEFFYFVNGALTKMDLGVRTPDLTIDQTIHN